MRFRLRNEKGCKAGDHIEKDPKTGKDVRYKAGDVIESERDLCEIFGKKFERIPTAEDFANPGKPNIIDKRFESPEAEKEALQKRLDELNIKDDDSEEDDSDEEDNNDDDDSEDTSDDDQEDQEDDDDSDDEDEDQEDDDDSDDEDEDEEVDPTTLGEDVTDKFPKAIELKVKVFMTGNSWFVAYDPEDKTLLNEDGKKLHKAAMEELLDSYDDEE